MRVIAALVFAATLSGTAMALAWGIPDNLSGAIPPVLVFTVPATIVVALLCGYPAFIFMRDMRWLSWWQLGIAGALLAALFAIPFFGVAPTILATAAGSGAFGGILFWWAAVGPNYSIKGNINRTD